MVLRKNDSLASSIHGKRLEKCPELFNDTTDLGQMLADRLSAAVSIPTVIHDDIGKVGEDKRWDVFRVFNDFLRDTFPLVHQRLDLTTVNKYGLVYTWVGSDPELKPLLLMAHSDVVPADSSSTLWTHPPYSGKIDDGFVWGRGSEDDKSNLTAMLSVLEHLIAAGFRLARTVLMSIGFDEEGGSDQSQGAARIAEHLLDVYGPNGIEMIFDEGIAAVENEGGAEVALPAVAEKGYLDVTITVNTPGGHSSLPPLHTAIGILAQAVCVVENARIGSAGPDADHTPSHLMRQSSELQSFTAKAVTLIQGGEKVNSLPEIATAVVNNRIGHVDSVQSIKTCYSKLLSPLAEQHGLTFVSFDGTEAESGDHPGKLTLTGAYALEPSPVTDINESCFSALELAIRKTFGDQCQVRPTLLDGNTDTMHFWELSKSIYRMSPWRACHDLRGTRMHTVDERMPIEGLIEMWSFYKELIMAMNINL